jgi:lysophospholipase L1-like esterase
MGTRTVRIATVATVLVLGLVLGLATPAHAAKSRAQVRRPGPPRVLLIGDSITNNYEQEAVTLLSARGYQVIPFGIFGTGLLDANNCKGHFARDVMRYVDPDVVVVEYIGNYGGRVEFGVAPCEPMKPYGSKAWLRRWGNAAKNNYRAYGRRGARVFFVQVPSVNFSPKREVVPQINAIYRGLGGPTIDAWTAFGGAPFDQSLRKDGQHLNQAGAEKMAALVAQAVG